MLMDVEKYNARCCRKHQCVVGEINAAKVSG